jgi:transcriptional regulator with XRE-family HTH domain
MVGDTRAKLHYATVLRSARAAAGLGQRELARYSGVAKQTIAKVETRGSVPRPSTWSMLTYALQRYGVHIEEIGSRVSIRFDTDCLPSSLEESSLVPDDAPSSDITNWDE